MNKDATEAALWCVHLAGPDTYYATASLDQAERDVAKHNADMNKIVSEMPGLLDDAKITHASLLASVAEWPGGPSSHRHALIERAKKGVAGNA